MAQQKLLSPAVEKAQEKTNGAAKITQSCRRKSPRKNKWRSKNYSVLPSKKPKKKQMAQQKLLSPAVEKEKEKTNGAAKITQSCRRKRERKNKWRSKNYSVLPSKKRKKKQMAQQKLLSPAVEK